MFAVPMLLIYADGSVTGLSLFASAICFVHEDNMDKKEHTSGNKCATETQQRRARYAQLHHTQ